MFDTLMPFWIFIGYVLLCLAIVVSVGWKAMKYREQVYDMERYLKAKGFKEGYDSYMEALIEIEKEDKH